MTVDIQKITGIVWLCVGCVIVLNMIKKFINKINDKTMIDFAVLLSIGVWAALGFNLIHILFLIRG